MIVLNTKSEALMAYFLNVNFFFYLTKIHLYFQVWYIFIIVIDKCQFSQSLFYFVTLVVFIQLHVTVIRFRDDFSLKKEITSFNFSNLILLSEESQKKSFGSWFGDCIDHFKNYPFLHIHWISPIEVISDVFFYNEQHNHPVGRYFPQK